MLTNQRRDFGRRSVKSNGLNGVIKTPSFFHSKCKVRDQGNRIIRLKSEIGEWCTKVKDMAKVVE